MLYTTYTGQVFSEKNLQEKLMSLKANITNRISSVKSDYTLPNKYFDDLTVFSNRLEYLA